MNHTTPFKARLATISCAIAFIALGLANTILGPTYSKITAQFNLPLQLGGMFTAFQFGAVTVSILITGQLVDRVNSRYLLSLGIGMIGIGLFTLITATTLPLAILGTILFGLGVGVLDVVPNVVVAALNPNNATQALNVINVFYGVGAILGPQVVSFALNQNNYQLAYYIAGGLALFLAIPFFLIIDVKTQPETHQATAKSYINWFSLFPFAVYFFLCVGIEVGYGSWIFTQIEKVVLVNASPDQIAFMGTTSASIFWAGLMSGRLFAPLCLRVFTDKQFLIVCSVLILAGVGLLLGMPTFSAVALVATFIVGFGTGPLFPIAFVLGTERYPEYRGMISSLLIASGTIGASVVPYVQGQIGGSKDGGMIVTVVLGVILMVLSVYILLQKRQSSSSPRTAENS